MFQRVVDGGGTERVSVPNETAVKPVSSKKSYIISTCHCEEQ